MGRCVKWSQQYIGVCAFMYNHGSLNLDMLMWTFLTGGIVIGMPPCLALVLGQEMLSNIS